ncbi:MAG: hypothetical protein QGH83_08710 [Candidatus Pacebacteria bacterium]|jgi:hypothetical protein|nr:hypothetical protein [Candidatus Paceibacterota bacterium]|tara:strand:- start:324 stop:515 length:192 start_codon:yes stop_codon:yes gene_type:complete
METVLFDWGATQAWWGIFTTVVVAANAVTMTLKDSDAVKIPFLGKIWPILNWLSLNIAKNKNK